MYKWGNLRAIEYQKSNVMTFSVKPLHCDPFSPFASSALAFPILQQDSKAGRQLNLMTFDSRVIVYQSTVSAGTKFQSSNTIPRVIVDRHSLYHRHRPNIDSEGREIESGR